MTEQATGTCGDEGPAAAHASTRERDWAVLIRRIACGEHDALGDFYDATSSLVYSLVRRILGNITIAEEVTLDVYTQVWRRAGSYDAGRGSPVSWLIMMARSRAIDRLRAAAPTQERLVSLEVVQEPASAINPEEASVVQERRRLVRAAFAVLPHEQRQVLELVYFSELSHRAIADQLGLAPGTVKTRLRLGMVKLREHLRPLME